MANGKTRVESLQEMLAAGRLEPDQALELILLQQAEIFDMLEGFRDNMTLQTQTAAQIDSELQLDLSHLGEQINTYRPLTYYLIQKPLLFITTVFAFIIVTSLIAAILHGIFGTRGVFDWLFKIFGAP